MVWLLLTAYFHLMDSVTLSLTHYVSFSGWKHLPDVINVNINISKIVAVQAFHHATAFCKSTKFNVHFILAVNIHSLIYVSDITTKWAKKPKKRVLKDLRQKTMTETSSVDISIYLSSCDTFLNIPIEKWAETQHNLMNSNGRCPECQWFQSFLLLPIYIFHMGP